MIKRLVVVPCLVLLAACDSSSDAGDGAALPDGGSGSLDGAAVDAASDASVSAPDAQPEGGPQDASSDASSTPDAAPALPTRTYVYVGGYDDNKPFHMFSVDRSTLTLSEVQQDADVGPQASWICPSADGSTLYVANESDGQPGITVMKVDRATGIPSKLGHAPAINKSFVFCSLDPSGKFLLAASYGGGNVAVFPVQSDGKLGALVDQKSFAGGAQSHSIRVHPSGKWAFVPNKGLDSVAQFSFGGDGKLTANSPDRFSRTTPLFDGPRHIAFSPDGALAFVILELGNELTSFAFESDGRLRELDRKPRLPASFTAEDTGAHVLSHPNGKYVYGSNRGSNTIAAFAYDAAGKLTLLEHEPSRGKTPRGFDIDPSGQFMVVANQTAESGAGGSIALFAIEADGRLTAKASPITGLVSPVAVSIVGF